MPIPFSGPAIPLEPGDLAAVAARIGCEAAVIEAVLTVEVGGLACGGFLSDGSGRPRILFEASHFSAATGGRWDDSHPTISRPGWDRSLYRAGAAEYLRLEEAVAVDRDAALESASWGLSQILGENYGDAGFANVEDFVAAQARSEKDQLEAFVSLVFAWGIAAALRDKDWQTIARRWNGPSYARNNYDANLADAYLLATGRASGRLRIGCSGQAVRDLQEALDARGADLCVDGDFGRATELAVQRFQVRCGLDDDGVAGTETLKSLGLYVTGES